jgi:hypothetical protein
MVEIDSKAIWLERGFSEAEAETIARYYKERYGVSFNDDDNDRRIYAASHRCCYTLDSDMQKFGFSSRLDMARAILQGQRDDLLY